MSDTGGTVRRFLAWWKRPRCRCQDEEVIYSQGAWAYASEVITSTKGCPIHEQSGRPS